MILYIIFLQYVKEIVDKINKFLSIYHYLDKIKNKFNDY